MFEQLKEAINTNNVAEVTKLIALCNKLDLVKEVANREYESLLHLAAEKGNCKIFNLLLSKDPNLVDALDCTGRTVLHYAVEKEHIEMVDVLLEKMSVEKIKCGEDAHYLSYDAGSGVTALHLAAHQGNKVIVEKLLARCPELISKCATYDSPPLNSSANDEIAEILLSKMSPEMTLKLIKQTEGITGRNALHSAISGGKVKTAEKLLTLDPNLAEVVDKYGHTALAYVGNDKLKGKEIEIAGILTPQVIKLSLKATTQSANISAINDNLNKIINVCNEALEKNPSDASIYFKKGNILYGIDKVEEAVKCYETAQRINPDYTEKIYINISVTTVNTKEENESSSAITDSLNTTTVADQQQEEAIEAIGKSEDGFCILI